MITRTSTLVLLLILLGGCAAPFKTMPRYYELQDRIQTIALYPLHYTKDGKNERLFGMVFSEAFFCSLKTMPTVRPLKFISPDSVVALLKEKGVEITVGRKEYVIEDTARVFPIYKTPTPEVLRVISKEVDGVIFCDLLSYHEKTLAELLVGGCMSAFSGVPAGTYGESKIKMKITLLETMTGTPIWEYKAHFTGGYSKQIRKIFTQRIIKRFQRYFPLSKKFRKYSIFDRIMEM